MDFATEYGLFLAKVATLVVFLLILVGGLVFILRRAKAGYEEHLEVKHLNHKYERMALILQSAILPRKHFKQMLKGLRAKRKQEEKSQAHAPSKKKVFVLNFKGDVRASAVTSLREEITAILSVATPQDEVLVRLESIGGMVHAYGLAASQLRRIKDHNIPLTVAVDHVAASGGYMMACVADRIIAAPFAVLGSIGVVGQLPNFNRLLKDHQIDYELHTAGEYKRTLTIFGENTEKGREKFRAEIEEIHALFKEFVMQHRREADIKKVATGEHWYGLKALELKLVDELRTSDDYLREAAQSADLYELTYLRRRSIIEKLLSPAFKALGRLHRPPGQGWDKLI